MYIYTSAAHNSLQGEPGPEALHREEYYESREEKAEETTSNVAHPALRERAVLLRAQVVAGVGRFFA